MNTFQIVLKGGLTRNIAADRCRTSKESVRFYVAGQVVANYARDSVIMIDKVDSADFQGTVWRWAHSLGESVPA